MKIFTKKLFSSIFTTTLICSPLISTSLANEVSTAETGLGFIVTNDPTKTRSGGY